MYKHLLILLLFCCIQPILAQVKPSVSITIAKVKKDTTTKILRKDSSKIDLRTFDKTALKKYQENPDFNYYIPTETKSLSMWDRFWDWFWHVLENFFTKKRQVDEKPSPSILKYILLAVVIIAVVYIVVKLLGDDLANIFTTKPKEVHLPFSESLENIHEISFDDEIENALQRKDFRLAVRLLYLNSLKKLNDAGLIDWQIEKTNATYLKELKNEAQKTNFSVLTRQFEYVWYGDFPVNQQSFENIKTLFVDFKSTLP